MTDPSELFTHRLAGHLGCRVYDIEHYMTEYELSRWVLYYNTEPFGFPREDQRYAEMVVAILAASQNTIPKKYLSPDFWRYRVKKAIDVQQFAAVVKSLPKTLKRRRRKKQEQSTDGD